MDSTTLCFLAACDDSVAAWHRDQADRFTELYPQGRRPSLAHLRIAVDTLAPTLERLTAAGLEPGPVQYSGAPRGPKTSWLTDPDGYRIELVEWPPGHPHGITASDFR
ncbi:VOC family protein [Streptomyces sp. NPDC057499]|uniref:VOC family protein n=1 Tax=Streptomyces sp. NPDC057499 TaxID=3346150 RepID=UPI0036981EAE